MLSAAGIRDSICKLVVAWGDEANRRWQATACCARLGTRRSGRPGLARRHCNAALMKHVLPATAAQHSRADYGRLSPCHLLSQPRLSAASN